MGKMTFLNAVKAQKPSLREMLHKHIAGEYPARDIATLHASELTKDDPYEIFCAREKAILVALGEKWPDEFISTSLGVTFQIGRLLEEQVIQWFAEMGKAVGNWKCVYCGSLHEFQYRPKACKSCDSTKLVHKEMRFVSDETLVSAGVDMFLDLGGPKITPVEIKTIDKDQFKKIVMPLAEHRTRTSLYLRTIAESKSPLLPRIDTSTAKVLYVSKGGYGCSMDDWQKWMFKDDKFSPFKDFEVNRDDTLTDPYVAKAALWKQYKTTGKMPARICSTSFCNRAKGCRALIACWSGEY